MSEPEVMPIYENEITVEILKKAEPAYVEHKQYFKLSVSIIKKMLKVFDFNDKEKDIIQIFIPWYKKFYKNKNFKFFDSFLKSKAENNDKVMARILVFLYCTPSANILLSNLSVPLISEINCFLNYDISPSDVILKSLHNIITYHMVKLNYSNAQMLFEISIKIKLLVLNIYSLPDGIKIRKFREREAKYLLRKAFITFLSEPLYDDFDEEEIINYEFVLKITDRSSEYNRNEANVVILPLLVLHIDHTNKSFLEDNELKYCELLVEK